MPAPFAPPRARIGLNVPPGLTITTKVCEDYTSARKLPPGVWEEVEGALAEIEEAYGAKFADPANPMLLSVRSGAAVSMPGARGVCVCRSVPPRACPRPAPLAAMRSRSARRACSVAFRS